MISTNEQNWKPRSSGKAAIVMSRVHGGFGKLWRCTCCGKLLGRHDGCRMEVRIGTKIECSGSLPFTSRCPRCGTLNEYTGNPECTKRVTHN